MEPISLPISIGEAIDKLSILDIKLDKIQDNRRNDVEKEYNLIREKLKIFIENYSELYKLMKEINLIIWDQMDVLRDGKLNDNNYTKLCRECIETNDIRFRIKNKINLISNSALKEQKSYKTNRLMIKLHCDESVFNLFIKPISYFSFIYDEISIISNKSLILFKDYFHYDSTIKFNEMLEGKNTFEFGKKFYNLNEIYKIMGIDDKTLAMYKFI